MNYFPKTTEILTRTFKELGEMYFFTVKVVKQFTTPPYEHQELLKQAYIVGNKSFGLIAATGFIMGLVLTIQTKPVMTRFGAESMIPGMVAISIIREIGPVVTALLAAGKISSGIAAEIGAMKVTEQIDAMEVSGTKPLGFVVATRVLATTLFIPLLALFADIAGLFGSFLALNMTEQFSFQLFFKSAVNMVDFIDFIPPVIKTVFFGFFVGIIGSFKGYKAGLGTESVGLAANSAVVSASFAIFITDLLATLITSLFLP